MAFKRSAVRSRPPNSWCVIRMWRHSAFAGQPAKWSSPYFAFRARAFAVAVRRSKAMTVYFFSGESTFAPDARQESYMFSTSWRVAPRKAVGAAFVAVAMFFLAQNRAGAQCPSDALSCIGQETPLNVDLNQYGGMLE